MARTLLLGLGGTGSRIVNSVADELTRNKIGFNNGEICCAVLDTDSNDNKRLVNTKVGVPVIATSKNRTIKDYIRMYSAKGIKDWMPESPSLLMESMKDGASQMRPKSRLALMDCIADKTIDELQKYIVELFGSSDDDKVRVMIVSSLAGGTGSGMFIQVALWLRKFFTGRRCSITIRGIFVLPDVFIKTIKDIHDDDTEKQSLYANAYGAIRELNAITKIKTKEGFKLSRPLVIDDLFNSEKNQPDGLPVYNYAFFVDDIAEGGGELKSITDYEQVIARLVYMQLFAPMHDDMYSEEDNLFKRFQKSEEPVFGACGTAKAIYPFDDVLEYCVLRATQESISVGWRRIDEEIQEKQRREEEKVRNGMVSIRRIDPRAEYMRLFEDKASKTGNEIGSDRLFVNIALDVKNEIRRKQEDGTYEAEYTDKVEDFIEELNEMVVRAVDSDERGSVSALRLPKTWVNQDSDDAGTLQRTVQTKAKAVTRYLTDFKNAVDEIAEGVVDSLCPTNIGDINQENISSVYGFFTKKDNAEKTYFVHPIAIRYLLYKLSDALEEIKNTTDLESSYSSAEKGYGNGKKKISFDNPKTREVEKDAIAYLKSKGRFQSQTKFLAEFRNLYYQHNSGQVELCRAYAIDALKYYTAVKLSERISTLTEVVETFFRNLVKVSNTVRDKLFDNIQKNAETSQKIIYVCASEKEKEARYKTLQLDTVSSNKYINAIIAKAIYSRFCVEENSEALNNAKYKDESIERVFFKEVTKAYGDRIKKKNNSDIDLNIYAAVCASSDFAYEAERSRKAQLDDEEDDSSARLTEEGGLDEEEVTEQTKRHQRHVQAMMDLTKELRAMSAPFLITDDECPEDPDEHLTESDDDGDEGRIFTPIKKRKTFWGFNPVVVRECPELASILGVDVSKQQKDAYRKSELDCYRAVYGVQAGYVPKFNELAGGEYYRNYNDVVRSMVAETAKGNESELIYTPHLDKTWHLFLPYITPEKQIREDSKFFRLFWLAMAYQMISVNAEGKFQIARKKTTATGSYLSQELILNNGKPIGQASIIDLIAALRIDGNFMIEAERLEKKFQEESQLSTYQGTEFFGGTTNARSAKGKTEKIGGVGANNDSNAVTIIAKYFAAPRHSEEVCVMMIQSLEKLCRELVASNYETESEDAKIQGKALELCRAIYENSTSRTKKSINLIQHWF